MFITIYFENNFIAIIKTVDAIISRKARFLK